MNDPAPNWPMPLTGESTFRPLAHVAMRDTRDRTAIADALRRLGFAVVEAKSGYHLLSKMAVSLLGEQAWMEPQLIVVDAFSPGCSGLTIAQGLRDLGRTTEVVLVARDSEQLARLQPSSETVHVTTRELALHLVVSVARRVARNPGSDSWLPQEDAAAEEVPTFTAFPPSRLMA